MQSTLSTELWERVIDLVAQSNNPRRWDFQWRERDLCACILVTRLWVHRSRFHLFNYILLDSDRRTKRFLYALTLSPDLSKYVTALEVYPDDPDGPHDWIYRALFSLPRRIPHLHKLTFYGLPYLHSNLITRLSCFKMVESLELHRLDRQSFREIILIVNRFPRLQRLYVHRCEWDWPIAYYSGKNRKLLSLQAHEFSNSQHSEDVLSWALASKSTSNLTTFSAIISPTESPGFDSTISRILQNCRSTLREVEFNIIGDAGKSLTHATPQNLTLHGRDTHAHGPYWFGASPNTWIHEKRLTLAFPPRFVCTEFSPRYFAWNPGRLPWSSPWIQQDSVEDCGCCVVWSKVSQSHKFWDSRSLAPARISCRTTSRLSKDTTEVIWTWNFVARPK